MQKQPTTLLIEDDDFIAQLLETKFKESGLNLAIAENGEEGLKKAKELKPSLILLDILLPGIDGFEVLRQLQSDKTTASLPVIILSNLGQKEEIKKGLDLGAQDFLVKAHFDLNDIVKKVKEYIKEHA